MDAALGLHRRARYDSRLRRRRRRPRHWGLAQVKFEASQVGRPILQKLVGARGRRTEQRLLCFTGAGYSSHAVGYAEDMEIALFTYTLTGDVTPLNRAARQLAAQAPTSVTRWRPPLEQPAATARSQHTTPAGPPARRWLIAAWFFGVAALLSTGRLLDETSRRPASETAFLVATATVTVLVSRQYRIVKLLRRAAPETGWPTAAVTSLLLAAAAAVGELTDQDDAWQAALTFAAAAAAMFFWHIRRRRAAIPASTSGAAAQSTSADPTG